MKTYKLKLSIIIIFLALNISTYYLTEINKDKSINIEFNTNLVNLKTHLEILLYNQEKYANIFYRETVGLPNFLEIFSEFKTASKEKKAILRDKLYILLESKYEIMKSEGMVMFQFISPENRSILRMHKPNKFGDDLTYIREDFVFSNKDKLPVRVFTQGRTAHGFRNVYPIFDKNGAHLGAMEISFSSESFQKYLIQVTKLHTNFIISKSIFNKKSWKESDLIFKYKQSSEHKDYLVNIENHHDEDEHNFYSKHIFLDSISSKIIENFKKGKEFSLYTSLSYKDIDVISFFPVQDITKTKNLAWFVAYQKSDAIYRILKSNLILRTVLFFIFAVLGYLAYKKILMQQKVKDEHRLLNDIINSTNTIMFVSNFKDLFFSNKRFKTLFNIEKESDFKIRVKEDLVDIFTCEDGFLHSGLLNEKQSFNNLIMNTEYEERVVLIYRQAFHISTAKTGYSNNKNCLVTLTDITKIKEREKKIQRKAYIDSITGVPNRNMFDEVATKELVRDSRYKRDLTIGIVDIDFFKKFNDTYGHLVGDEVLIMIAQYINGAVRDTDTFARWGGEEFVILLPETNIESAVLVCEKLREGIANLSHQTAGGVTASFGITQHNEGDTLLTIFKRCDDALYEAKKNGRNQVRTK